MDYRARFMRLPMSIQQTSPDPAVLRPWDLPPSSPLPVFESNSNVGSSARRNWFDAVVVKRRQGSSQTEDGSFSPGSSRTVTRPAPAFKDPRSLPLSSAPTLSPSLTKSTSSGVNLPMTPRTPDSGVPLLLTPAASASGAFASPPPPLSPNTPGAQKQAQGASLGQQPFRDEALAVVATFMRAARLAGMPFATAGACQIYNAYVGFCSEVFGRGATQLKSWELDDPEEAGVEWRETGTHGQGPEEVFELQDPPSIRKRKQDLESIVPFDLDVVPSLSVLPSAGGPHEDRSSAGIILSPSSVSFDSPKPTHEVAFVKPRPNSSKVRYTKPPVLGPERVVLDERIRQYHFDVMHDTFMVGIWYCLIYTAVVLAIPGPKPV
ncbi:hypothetical protein FRB90_002236 [Tulasnella sp. 427]|nr:hypothetical protein FRB90_002236 [Tulasnella sp. 427]